MIVAKFGGSSVGTLERLQCTAQRIRHLFQKHGPMAIVVSAMGDTTDELITKAYQICRQPPHREMDMLLSVGERITMSLLSMALHELGISAISYTGSQSGIITSNHHRRARILDVRPTRILETLARGKIALIAGFQGVSYEKEITTLGRGGSDTSAVALAISLHASECLIFTDVDGLSNWNPRKFPGAHHFPELPIDYATELSHCGASVMHSRAMELAFHYKLPIRVCSSFVPAETPPQGTLITPLTNTTDVKMNPISNQGALVSSTFVTEKTTVISFTTLESHGWLQICWPNPDTSTSPWISQIARWIEQANAQGLFIQDLRISDHKITGHYELEFESDWKDFLQQFAEIPISFELRSDLRAFAMIVHHGSSYLSSLPGQKWLAALEDAHISLQSLEVHPLSIRMLVPESQIHALEECTARILRSLPNLETAGN